jgi:hypothetical protein
MDSPTKGDSTMCGKHRVTLRAVPIRMLDLATFALFALLAAAPTDAQDPGPGDVVRARVNGGGRWLEYTLRNPR